MNDLDALRFPIGPFRPHETMTSQERSAFIDEIEAFPTNLREAVSDLSREELETPYREGGWTVRQVVHHVADSHLQGYVRFKLAMTEDTPTIRTYQQAPWGETADSRTGPVGPSLDILEALHKRWVFFLRTLSDEDFQRTYLHPDMGELSLETTVQLYAWHGEHHLAHVGLVSGGA